MVARADRWNAAGPEAEAGAMNSDIGLESASPTDRRDFWDDPKSRDSSPPGVTDCLTRRAALTVVLALSLGLWAAIWTALASLATAVFG
jgi:hypothetical protein